MSTAMVTTTTKPTDMYTNQEEDMETLDATFCVCDHVWAYLLDDPIIDTRKLKNSTGAKDENKEPTAAIRNDTFENHDRPTESGVTDASSVGEPEDLATPAVQPFGLIWSSAMPPPPPPPPPPPQTEEIETIMEKNAKKGRKLSFRHLRRRRSSKKVGSDKYKIILRSLTEESGYSAADSVTSGQLRREDLRTYSRPLVDDVPEYE